MAPGSYSKGNYKWVEISMESHLKRGMTGLCLDPVLFRDFIRDVDTGVEGMLTKFAEGRNLGGVAIIWGEGKHSKRLRLEINRITFITRRNVNSCV